MYCMFLCVCVILFLLIDQWIENFSKNLVQSVPIRGIYHIARKSHKVSRSNSNLPQPGEGPILNTTAGSTKKVNFRSNGLK